MKKLLILLSLFTFNAAYGQTTTKPNISNTLSQCIANAPIVGNGSNVSPICHASGALGTAAFVNTGTSGATIGLLNTANTWSATQAFAALTATTINGNTFTTGTGTLTIAAAKTVTHNASTTFAGVDGKTLTINNTLTFTGTDGSSVAFGAGGTITYNPVTSVTCGTGLSGGAITTTGTCAVNYATKSDQQTATSTVLAVNPSQQQSHPSAAKGWAFFNGSSASCPAGVCSISSSYNVTSITRNSAGNYTVVWSTAFTSANYAAVVQCADNGSGTFSLGLLETVLSTSANYICVTPATLTAGDSTKTAIVAFGTQ